MRPFYEVIETVSKLPTLPPEVEETLQGFWKEAPLWEIKLLSAVVNNVRQISPLAFAFPKTAKYVKEGQRNISVIAGEVAELFNLDVFDVQGLLIAPPQHKELTEILKRYLHTYIVLDAFLALREHRPPTSREELEKVFKPLANEWFNIENLFEVAEQLANEEPIIANFHPAYAQVHGGFRKHGMTILASQSGGGKTAIALNILRKIAENEKIPVAFISIEMPIVDVVRRVIQSLDKVEESVVNSYSPQYVIERWKTHFEDRFILVGSRTDYGISPANPDLRLIRRDIEELAKKGVKIVAIDYLQIIQTLDDKEDASRYTKIMRELREVSAETGVHLLILSQINRESARTARWWLNASDIKYASQAEHDAHTIITLTNLSLLDKKLFEKARKDLLSQFSDFFDSHQHLK